MNKKSRSLIARRRVSRDQPLLEPLRWGLFRLYMYHRPPTTATPAAAIAYGLYGKFRRGLTPPPVPVPVVLSLIPAIFLSERFLVWSFGWSWRNSSEIQSVWRPTMTIVICMDFVRVISLTRVHLVVHRISNQMLYYNIVFYVYSNRWIYVPCDWLVEFMYNFKHD